MIRNAYIYTCFIAFYSWKLVSGLPNFNIDFVVNEPGKGLTLRLFQCYQRGHIGNQEKRRQTQMANLVPCVEITSEEEKTEAYSKTNFYLVNRLQMKDSRPFVFTNRETGVLQVPMQVSLGIKYSYLDFPVLVDEAQRGDFYREQSLAKIRNTLPNIFADVNQDELLTFLGVASFSFFADSRYDNTGTVEAYAGTLKNVVRAYDKDFLRVPAQAPRIQGSMTEQQRIQNLNKLRVVVSILLQKMIDPCLIMSYQKKYVLGDKSERNKVVSWCGHYCGFISIATRVFNVRPSQDCGQSFSGGKCANTECLCEWGLDGCSSKAFTPFKGSVAMAECHNELRKFIPPLVFPA